MKNAILYRARKLQTGLVGLQCRAHAVLTSERGNFLTDHLGSIVVGIFIVGLVITALTTTLPGILTGMLTNMQTKLNNLWASTGATGG